MTLFNSKYSHFYGSEAWDFTHEAVERFSINYMEQSYEKVVEAVTQ